MSEPRIPEARIQSLILARLQALDGVFVWRQNTGTAKSGERFVKFGITGQADISGIIRGGRRLEVEIKSQTGRLRPEQVAFGRQIRELGGLYIVARTLAEALAPVVAALYPDECPHPVAALVQGVCVACGRLARIGGNSSFADRIPRPADRECPHAAYVACPVGDMEHAIGCNCDCHAVEEST